MAELERVFFWPAISQSMVHGGRRVVGIETHRPVVTVVIAVFNGQQVLEATLDRIIENIDSRVELIVVDGGSRDGTRDILERYNRHIDYWISEVDRGIADAFNKGLRLSRGDYINFQGDGDGFCSRGALSGIVDMLDRVHPIMLGAQINRVALDGRILYSTVAPRKFQKESVLLKMSLPHQGLFVSWSFFSRWGGFDERIEYCMDYEHLLRGFCDLDGAVIVPEIVANWRADGLGNGKTLQVLKEYHRVRMMHSVAPKIILWSIHGWSLLKYWAKRLILGVR